MSFAIATPSEIEALSRAAVAWEGTPWRPNAKVRGVGASCQHAVAGILRDAGVMLPEIPDGPADWSRHQTRSIQAEWLDAHPEYFAPVPLTAIREGDIVGFRLGSCIHHLGVVLVGNACVHSIKQTGVRIISQAEPLFRNHVTRAWRPLRRTN